MIHRNKKRYITERINEEVDEELQSIIWKMHEFLGEKRKDKMDINSYFSIKRTVLLIFKSARLAR